MTAMDGIRLALRSLQVNPLRTVLAVLGIIIGVAAFVTMVSVGTGAQQQVAEQIRSLGSNMIVVMSGTVTSGGVRLGSGSQSTLTDEDATALQRDVSGVQAAAATLRGGGQVVFGNMNWSTAIQGVTPEYFEAREWFVTAGRNLTQQDSDGGAKVAVLGQTVVGNLFGDTDPLDRVIRIKKVPFTVVGVLERKGQSLQGQDQDDVVLVPLATARERVLGTSAANRRSVGSILIKAADASLLPMVEADSRDLLRQRHRLQPGQDDDFWMRNLSEVLQTQEASARILTTLLAAVAAVSLVVGGIGIMNIMLVSVTERTREIGLRLALGARARDILGQFLLEATMLSGLGGLLGLGVGALCSLLIARLAGWPSLLEPAPMLLAFAFSAIIGVFFGFYPARKAARLDPIEALRHE